MTDLDQWYYDLVKPVEGWRNPYFLRIDEQIVMSRGVAWTGRIWRDGELFADVEHRGDGGAPHVYFREPFRDNRAVWEADIEAAYAGRESQPAGGEESLIGWLDILNEQED